MSNVDSPCVRHCCLSEEDICLGCFRSMEEIMQWGSASDQDKEKIIHIARKRKTEHANKYGKFQT